MNPVTPTPQNSKIVASPPNHPKGFGSNGTKIFVHAKPSSKRPEVEKLDEAHYTVSVQEPAKENKANFAIIKALAIHFGVPLSRIRLLSGKNSRQKMFGIMC